MQYVYDSRGRYIAVIVGTRLFSRTGKNIGHWLERQEIFIDQKGRYLGELYERQRLLHNKYSPHLYNFFGLLGQFGTIGKNEDPGRVGIIGMPLGYADVDPGRLG